MKQYTFDEFMDIIKTLRSDNGCPWDREQTHESLVPCIREEAYEVIDAIHRCDTENLREELGDVLLQVAMHSVIGEEKHEFDISDVISGVSEKMIRRHPHVFRDAVAANSEDVVSSWEEIKRQEHNEKSVSESMIHVPRALPACIRAEKVLKKAAKSGYETGDRQSVLAKVSSALKTLAESSVEDDQARIEENYEELVFQAVNLSRFLQLNAENSLTNATDKFINRFVSVERSAKSDGLDLKDMSVNE